MASRVLFRLACPSYDCVWISVEENGEKNREFVLVAGGGGTGNTGVKNQLQIGTYNGKGDFDFLSSFETDHDGKQRFCSGVCHGRIDGTQYVCALLETQCLILSVHMPDKNSKTPTLKRLAEFTADFAEKEPSANCCCIASNYVVTGGEDGIVRMWSLSKKDSTYSVSLKPLECRGHSAPIMAINKHPTEPWICSSSKDGTCKIWNTKNAELLADIASIDENSGISSAQASSLQCRGCVFSNDGNYLYTMHCGRRGATRLIKFLLTKEKDKLSTSAQHTIIASKEPSSRLVMSDSGEFVACGCSNGFVSTFRSDTLVKTFSLCCHDDYPVTGLTFAPTAVAAAEGVISLLVTCSVDNRMTVVTMRKGRWLLIAALVLVIALLLLMYVN